MRPSFGSLASGCTCSGRWIAKLFLKKALANPDNRPPHVFARDGLRSYPAALRALQAEGRVAPRCRQRARRYSNNRIESDHRHVKRRLRTMQGPRTKTTAWAVIQGIEAAYMIRKGQGLGITRRNLHGQAWLFGALLGVRQSAKFAPGATRLFSRRRCNTTSSSCCSPSAT
jgi:transposase, IS6 family